MIAEVEQPDGTFVDEERTPVCGDFCETCGECLGCWPFCVRVDDQDRWVCDWAPHKWVIRRGT